MSHHPADTKPHHKLGLLNLCQTDLASISMIWDLLHLPAIHEQAKLDVQALHSNDVSSTALTLPGSLTLVRGLMFDTVLLVANMWTKTPLSNDTKSWLKQQYLAGAKLILIGRVSEALGNHSLLQGRQAACHWSLLDSLHEQYPQVAWSKQLYCQDERLFTSPGGGSSADVVRHWLTTIGRSDLGADLSEWWLLDKAREMDTEQRVPLQTRLGNSQPKLTEAVTLMEANLEEPLSSDDLAGLIGISRRHLERLFKRHLDQVPSKFYLHLRLEKARGLIRDTDLSIVEVSMMSGFSSASHFSTSYRSHFGITPRQERGRSTCVETNSPLAGPLAMQARLD